MKTKQVQRWLVGLVSLVGLLWLSAVLTPLKAAAQDFNAGDFLTAAQVTNGPDFKPADTIDIQYKLDFGTQQLHQGDTVTIELPSNLKPKTVGDTFDVVDTDGTVIGVAKVTTDSQVVITLNEALEGKTNDKMVLNLATRYRDNDYGEKEVIFNDNFQSTINIVTNEANLSKKGTIQDNGTVKWTVLVNRRELEMKNLKISDTIGANQVMIKDVTVYNGEWSSNASYKRRDKLSDQAYTVNYSETGFDMTFNQTVNKLIVIDYYTKITDDSLTNSGYKFRNKAVMTWGGGTSGAPNSEQANGSVSSSNGNSGSGTGDEDGTETTEEPDDEDTGTIDTDDGFDEAVDPEPTPKPSPEPDKSTSSSSTVNSTSNSSSSAAITHPVSGSSATGKTSTAQATTTAATKTQQQPTKTKTLPQTNESTSDSHALQTLGLLVVSLTLGGGALLRHWY